MKNTSYTPDDFNLRLKAIRKMRRWTLERMSRKLGICAASLHRYEAGKGEPSFLTAAKMEKALPELFSEGQKE